MAPDPLRMAVDHIDFDDTLQTGIDDVDRQHGSLIEIYNELVDSVEESRANRVMNEILARLFQYAKVHFETEEALLEECGYGQLEEHREQHRRLLKSVRRYIFRHTRGGERVSSEVVEFLRDWITTHIREEDMAYVACLRARLAEGHTETSSAGV